MGPVPLISGAEAYVAPGRVHPIYLEGKLPILQTTTAAELGGLVSRASGQQDSGAGAPLPVLDAPE